MSLSQRLDAAIDAALGSRIVGCVVLVTEGERSLYERAAGFADREAAIPTQLDTIFRLASVTKPIVATAILRLADEGKLSLDDPVTAHLPFFTPKTADGTTPVITIRHLLTHTSGIVYGRQPEDVSPGADPGPLIPLEENLRRLARGTLVFAPGSRWAYGMSVDVLGGVLGALNGDISNVEAALQSLVLGPAGMADTRFGVTDRSRLAVAYGDDKPEPLRMAEPQRMVDLNGGVSMMSPERILNPAAPQSGGAGMAGTAGDFMSMLVAIDAGLLKPETRNAAYSPQIGELVMDRPGTQFGFLGAVVTDAAASGWPSNGLVHWGGIWGNNWVIDPATRTRLVVFTNTMWEGCNRGFRDEMRDAVFG